MPAAVIKAEDTTLVESETERIAIDFSNFSEGNCSIKIIGSMVASDGVSSAFQNGLGNVLFLQDGFSFYSTPDLGEFTEDDYNRIGDNNMGISVQFYKIGYGASGGEDSPVQKIYMPISSFNNPTLQQLGTGESESTFLNTVYSDAEVSGLSNKFGSLPDGDSEKVINNFIESLSIDAYQTFISKETIPNVIKSQPNIVLSADDFEGSAGVEISVARTVGGSGY